MTDKIVQLYRWDVYDFPWGSAVKEVRADKWHCVFLKPDGQEVDIQGLDVELHENGIEFLGIYPQGSGGDGPHRKAQLVKLVPGIQPGEI